MEETKEQQRKILQIFYPDSVKKYDEIINSKKRLVHYTSAEAAKKILANQEFWMRAPSSMNDYSEVEHGLECLIKAYDEKDTGDKFKDAIDSIQEGITKEIPRLFNEPFNPRHNHYIACLSEHEDNEDTFGRLSMWRAYGNKTGVAIVLNSKPTIDGPGTLNIVASPVQYLDSRTFRNHLTKRTQMIIENRNFLKSLDPKVFMVHIQNLLRFAALTTKHPGFFEEKEWRLIHSTFLGPSQEMPESIETINGIPQKVVKIPLGPIGEGKPTRSQLPELIDKIIIGPTEYSEILREAFIQLLRDAKVKNAEKRVVNSGIPLRT